MIGSQRGGGPARQRNARIAFSVFGELLRSALILNWRCTVEHCLDGFLFSGRWQEKGSLVSFVVQQEILKSSFGLRELVGEIELPGKKLRELAFFF